MESTQILLAARPVGEPDDSCFATEVVDLPDLEDGQVLLAHRLPLARPLHARPDERRPVVRRARSRSAT